jgi:hypothetical protein
VETTLRPQIGSPQGRFASLKAGQLIGKLIALDDLWTTELAVAKGSEELTDSTIQPLIELVEEMEEGLREVVGPVRELRLMLDEEAGDEAVEQALEDIGKSDWAHPDLTAMVTGEMIPGFSLRGAVITACDYISEVAPSESVVLNGKMTSIRRNRSIPDGDFGLPFRCALLLGLVGAGIALALSTPPGHVALVAIGIVHEVGLGALSWRETNCSLHLPKIGFLRREAKPEPP